MQFHHFLNLRSFVYGVHRVLGSLIPCVNLCVKLHNQDTGLCHHHRWRASCSVSEPPLPTAPSAAALHLDNGVIFRMLYKLSHKVRDLFIKHNTLEVNPACCLHQWCFLLLTRIPLSHVPGVRLNEDGRDYWRALETSPSAPAQWVSSGSDRTILPECRTVG